METTSGVRKEGRITRARCLALITGTALFAFFVPFIPMSGFPVFCWSNGNFGCMGGLVPGPPTIASISYRLFGYGGTSFQGSYRVDWP